MQAKEKEIPLDELISKYEEFRNGPSKYNAILQGITGITSMIASSLLIVMLSRSKKGLSTTQNRLLLGLSISDIIYSFTRANFNSMLPSDINYGAWNARGNLTTCKAVGYMTTLGASFGLLYNCSLNLYYLLVVKYTKSDEYMKRKIEPFLHAVPILYGIISSTVALTTNNLGNCSYFMSCNDSVYNPPHCYGYPLGEYRDGYDQIYCQRGSDGFKTIYAIIIALTMFLPPIFISITFVLLYSAAAKIERTQRQYGSSSFRTDIAMRRRRRTRTTRKGARNTNTDNNNNNNENNDEEKVEEEIEGGGQQDQRQLGNNNTSNNTNITTISNNTNNNHNHNNKNSNNSRSRSRSSLFFSSNNRTTTSSSTTTRVSKSTWIMRKAFGYAIAYFLTWLPFILHIIIIQIQQSDLPIQPLSYIACIFNPLQGFFTFLNYVYFRILNLQRSTNTTLSCSKAFYKLLFPDKAGSSTMNI